MIEHDAVMRRELAVRVATLELLIEDLIHFARRYDPYAGEVLAAEAALEIDAPERRFN